MAYLPKHGAQLLNGTPRCTQHAHRAVLGGAKWPFLAFGPRSILASSKSQQGLTQDSVDDIVDVLKDAFGTALIHSGTSSSIKPRIATHNGPGIPAHDNSSGRGAHRTSSLSKPSRSSPAHGASSHQSSGSGSDAPVAANANSKKRRGPFVDLISALQQDMKHAATKGSKHGSSSSSSSSSSSRNRRHLNGIASDAATAPGIASSILPSSSNTGDNDSHSGNGSSNSSSGARRSTRRIRGQQTSQVSTNIQQLQLQQQHPQPQQQPQQPLQQPTPSQQLQQPDWLNHPLVLAGGKKQYKPVYKGDLALPGGPAWSGLRRHVAAAGSNPDLPTLQCIVLLEGDQDQRAVARAVNVSVYICDGTRVLKGHVKAELEMLKLLGRPLVVLTDPDERGRELRVHLDDLIGPLSHAFVPEQQSMSTADGPIHSAGNRGIEHVVPIGVQQALATARNSYPRDRLVWSLQRLVELGLANAYDAGESAAGRGAAARRRQLCAVLGLGKCTGAQLVAMLNRFLDEETVDAALAGLSSGVH